MPLRKALLGACLALPFSGFAGAAHANPVQHERIIRVPPGAVVLLLPGAAAPQIVAHAVTMPALPRASPMLRIVAAQDAMMRQMMQQVRTLDRWTMSLPNPAQVIRAAMAGMPRQHIAPGTSVVTTMVSDGHGVCRETVTYRMTPHGAQPQVHMTRTGDDCGALTTGGPVGVMQAVPEPSAPPNLVRLTAPDQPRLWAVTDPPQPMAMGRPRT